jgi:hypothetical protein
MFNYTTKRKDFKTELENKKIKLTALQWNHRLLSKTMHFLLFSSQQIQSEIVCISPLDEFFYDFHV